MKQLLLFIVFILTLNSVFSQVEDLKKQAIEQFKKENYTSAIQLMEKALEQNSNDAEIYYYLGFFNHYKAYDSRPLKGYNSNYSDKILKYFDKALELNPNYGDAKYFYFTECSAVAYAAYQRNNLSQIKEQFEKAYQRGVIPEWAIELGKNILNSCQKDAILFTHGDYTLNICLFVQLHYDYRKDISLIPLSYLDRPSFVLALQENKASNVLRGVASGLTKEQILDMHPYKWDTTMVKIPIPNQLAKQYSIPHNSTMNWLIEPDLYSERSVSRIKGAQLKKQSFLSPARAMLINIIETNAWKRPIYFTNTFEDYYLAGLSKYFQFCGLISKLTPIETKGTPFAIDISVLEDLVFHNQLEKLKSIIDNNQPRASKIIYLYGTAYYQLAHYYKEQKETDKLSKLINKYKENLMIGFDSNSEQKLLKYFETMKK